MRRIYESQALRRDDEEPFAPNETHTETRLQAMRSVSGTALSRRFVPRWLENRAISIDVSTPKRAFSMGEPVPFEVTMKNSLPIPIVIATRSPVLWTWDVNDLTEAARVPLRDPPDESDEFRFDRGERKRFTKRWEQSIRVTEREWEAVAPGSYTIGAALNVDNAAERGLRAATTIRIDPE